MIYFLINIIYDTNCITYKKKKKKKLVFML